MLAGLDDYMDLQIDDYIANPRDDLTSFLLKAEIDDSKLAREHIRGTMILLMIAGIDATWSAPTRRSRWPAWSLGLRLPQTLAEENEWVLRSFPAANRDPIMFENPGRVELDRADNRHAAFGLGIHRCLGANLARTELKVALAEWLARYPGFEPADPAAVTWSGRHTGDLRPVIATRSS